LLLAAVPDAVAELVLGRWASLKYVVGESLVLLSLLAWPAVAGPRLGDPPA
jgi:hypothetical protein